MRVSTSTTAPEFKPVTVTIVCETQDELDALGVLFNSGHIMEAVRRTFSLADWEFYRTLSNAGADISSKLDVLHRALKGILA